MIRSVGLQFKSGNPPAFPEIVKRRLAPACRRRTGIGAKARHNVPLVAKT